jgi:hypothetical protein
MLAAGIQEGQALALPAPRLETIEDELGQDPYEGDSIEAEGRAVPIAVGGHRDTSAAPSPEVVAEPTAEDVERLEAGGMCDPRAYERRYFAAVRGTPLEGEQARKQLVYEYTKGAHEPYTDSLATLLGRSTIPEADAFLAWVLDQLPDEPEPGPETFKATGDDYERTYGKAYADEEPARFGAGSIAPGDTIGIPKRQPDGSLVDEGSGEILEAAPTMELERDPPEGEAPELPLFGDAPGLAPVAAMAQLVEDVAEDKSEYTAEPVDLDFCQQLHASAQKAGVEIEPPGAEWTGEQLRSYASTLTGMINAARQTSGRGGRRRPS